MVAKARGSRLRSLGLVLVFGALLAGCAHSRREQARPTLGSGDLHLVYFQPEPHSSLYVEVDEVEGAEFSEAELTKLQEYLGDWTKKPGGVAVVKSSLISRSAARGRTADELARRYMDGPAVAADQSQPAFIYILVYDNRINRNPPLPYPKAGGRAALDRVPFSLSKPENPHMVSLPYPGMIYIDRSWLGGLLPKKYWLQVLMHEAGHVLGMVSRASRVEGAHCSTNWCVMHGHASASVKNDLLNWVKRERSKSDFCGDCAVELRQFQTSASPAPSRFVGPVQVRTTPLYSVLTLPAFCGLYIGDSVEAEIPRFLEQFRTLSGRQGRWYTARAHGSLDRAAVLQALESALQDFDGNVREAARRLDRAVRDGEGEASKAGQTLGVGNAGGDRIQDAGFGALGARALPSALDRRGSSKPCAGWRGGC